MEFNLKGESILPMEHSEVFPYHTIRVLPESKHDAKAGPKGGCFLSVQHWLNGVKPTSVGNDWVGDSNMGENHTSQIVPEGSTKI